MLKKLLALTLAACLLMGSLILTAMAEGEDANGLVLIFEENFDEYEDEVNVSSTTMPSFFVCDYNGIGDGVINVQEATDGNLYLFSHVFTQIYNDTPIVGAYEFSLDVIEAQGSVQSGVYIRAPKTAAAYYEGDGYPDNSTCQAGLMIYPHKNEVGVNVKTYDGSTEADATAHLKNNTVSLALPDGVSSPYNLKVTDNGEEIVVYVNDILLCRVTLADPGKTYAKHESEGACYGSAKLYDANGTELGSYTDTLLCSDGSIIGWATRVANMSVDNVRVLVSKSHETLLAIGKLPSKVTDKNLEDSKELAAAARALYDALSEEEKALVTNFAQLTKTEEAITELENTTEAPTDPVTEPVTQPETQPETAPVETTETTSASDETTETTSAHDGDASGDTDESEVKVIDDSLAVWILIAVMIVAVCGTAGFITVKVRK